MAIVSNTKKCVHSVAIGRVYSYSRDLGIVQKTRGRIEEVKLLQTSEFFSTDELEIIKMISKRVQILYLSRWLVQSAKST